MDSLPPPVLDGARLLAYAIVDTTVGHVATLAPIVNGKPLSTVPGLAVCQQEVGTILLMFCDDHWSCIGVAQCSSLEEAKLRAEREYPGLSGKWIDANVNEQGAQYVQDQEDERRCSFCGKSPDAVQQLFTVAGAGICDGCVLDFHKALESAS